LKTQPGKRRGAAESGLTLLEMMIAIIASVIVALAISRLAVSNQRLIVAA
jgi:type II secretory pathway component PulJ